MTIEKLRSKIITKFGSISNFCRITNIDRMEIQKLFLAKKNKVLKVHQQERIDELNKLCSRTDKNGNSDKDLTAEIRTKIKEAIDELGGVEKFCETHPFSMNSVFQIVAGRRKFRTQKVNDLIDTLNIEI